MTISVNCAGSTYPRGRSYIVTRWQVFAAVDPSCILRCQGIKQTSVYGAKIEYGDGIRPCLVSLFDRRQEGSQHQHQHHQQQRKRRRNSGLVRKNVSLTVMYHRAAVAVATAKESSACRGIKYLSPLSLFSLEASTAVHHYLRGAIVNRTKYC